MRYLLVVMFLFWLGGCVTTSKSYVLSPKVHDNRELAFIPHHGQGPFRNYLAMNINFPPMSALFEQVKTDHGNDLRNRGEAHITVITPPEYDKVLSDKLTIEEIDEIALKANIQASEIELVCLGSGQAPVKEGTGTTYYVIVKAPNLIRIREQVGELYVSRGGNPDAFSAEHFYPHITLGFSPRDLHESDGVIKDSHSCIAQLN